MPAHDYAGLSVLLAFVVLGLACGLLAVVISKGVFLVERAAPPTPPSPPST